MILGMRGYSRKIFDNKTVEIVYSYGLAKLHCFYLTTHQRNLDIIVP